MKLAIACYDLKNVKPQDNLAVKAELLRFYNTTASIAGDNMLSAVPEWVHLKLPDTTVLVSVSDATTSEHLVGDVIEVIKSVGAEPDRVYVAFIESNCLWNSSKQSVNPFLALLPH